MRERPYTKLVHEGRMSQRSMSILSKAMKGGRRICLWKMPTSLMMSEKLSGWEIFDARHNLQESIHLFLSLFNLSLRTGYRLSVIGGK